MTRYRFTTLPTGALKGAWRDTEREAMEDAVAAGCGEYDDSSPQGIKLDVMVSIEPEATSLTEWELWACATETLKQYGDGAPAFVAERIGALALDGDTVGIAAWKAIAQKLDQLRDRSAPLQ